VKSEIVLSSFICSLLLLGCAATSSKPTAAPMSEKQIVSLIPKELLRKTSPAIFEVIVPKSEDSNVEYEKPLPFDRLPFQVRNDHYLSIGTAFAIDKNRFVSASHVFTFQAKKPWEEFYLRNQDGDVYKISKIRKYSSYRDLVEFSLEKDNVKLTPLELSSSSEMGDTIYVLGNALGEGISFRAGQISSYTPEEKNNQWKFIRFSAPASPGNSGGPLLNERGEVIGVVVRKNAAENLNYAVPIEELNKLSSSQAEFDLPNIPITHDKIRENHDLSFHIPLPQAPSELSKNAENKIVQLFEEIANKLYDLKDERFFPAEPSFREYITHQPATSHEVSFIYQNKDNLWNSFNPTPAYSHNKDARATVEVIRYTPNLLISIKKTDSTPLKNFVTDSKFIMDKVLKELRYSRTMAGEKIPVVSLGKAEKQIQWQDDLGRKWINYYWQFNSVNTFFVLECLPVPRGVVCAYNNSPLYASNFFIHAIETNFIDRILVNYVGSVSDWQEYLALDKKMLPELLQNTHVNLIENKELKINTNSTNLIIKNDKLNKSSKIIMRFRYSPKTNLALEVQDLQVSIDQNPEQYFKISSLIEPLKTSSEKLKERWENSKSHSGDFDGKIHNYKKEENNRVYISKNLKDHEATSGKIAFVMCGDKQNSKYNLVENCKSFGALNLPAAN
jgi:serine protease Do